MPTIDTVIGTKSPTLWYDRSKWTPIVIDDRRIIISGTFVCSEYEMRVKRHALVRAYFEDLMDA